VKGERKEERRKDRGYIKKIGFISRVLILRITLGRSLFFFSITATTGENELEEV